MCEVARRRLPSGSWSRRQPEGWRAYGIRPQAGRYRGIRPQAERYRGSQRRGGRYRGPSVIDRRYRGSVLEALEPLKKFCSHPVRPSGSGLFSFWRRFRSVTGRYGHAPSLKRGLPKPCQSVSQSKDVPLRGKQCQKLKILAPSGHRIFLKALSPQGPSSKEAANPKAQSGRFTQISFPKRNNRPIAARILGKMLRARGLCKKKRIDFALPSFDFAFTCFDFGWPGYGLAIEGEWLRKATEVVGFVGLEGNGVFRTQRFGREGGGDEGGQKWSACVRLGSPFFRKIKNLVLLMKGTEGRDRTDGTDGESGEGRIGESADRRRTEKRAQARAVQTLSRRTKPLSWFALARPAWGTRITGWGRAGKSERMKGTEGRDRTDGTNGTDGWRGSKELPRIVAYGSAGVCCHFGRRVADRHRRVACATDAKSNGIRAGEELWWLNLRVVRNRVCPYNDGFRV